MKVLHFIAVLLSLLVFSCSTPTSPTDATKLSPPSWIIGTWSDPSDINNYTFSSSNVVFKSTSVSINFKEAYANTKLSEVSNAQEYVISFTSGGSTGRYSFTKVTLTTLSYSITTGGLTVGPLELTKK